VTVVVDASVVVAGLASADATGEWAESVLAGEPLAAPHLMPAEAASILHRAELAGEISADAASLAHADLGRLRVEYFPYDPFAERIWELRSPGLTTTPGSPERARLFFQPGPASSGTDDPAEILGEGNEQQVEMLRRVRGRVADSDAARKRVDLQMNSLQKEITKCDGQARAALGQGREDLARAALSQKAQLSQQHDDLQGQYSSLQEQEQEQEEKLTSASQQPDARRWQKEAGERSGQPGLTSYEAWYVALAEFLGAKLATLDTRLALVPGPRCGFCLPPPLPA
jgi:predicted nucleic acid-binding protein